MKMFQNDLRRWITEASRLTEAAQMFEWPEEAYELILEYVTHGEMASPTQFDASFDRLMQLLPRPRKGQILFRVLRLHIDQVAQIRTGGLILPEHRRYTSWTKSQTALDRLVWDRQKGVDGESVVVIRQEVPAQNIVVDLVAFYRKYRLNNPDFSEWDRYVRPEHEVIVRHDGPWVITPDMVAEITTSIADTSVQPPLKGQAFLATNGKWERIAGMADADDQPGSSVFAILTVHGDLAFVRKDRKGRWIEVDM